MQINRTVSRSDETNKESLSVLCVFYGVDTGRAAERQEGAGFR